MARHRTWTDEQLKEAVLLCFSCRAVVVKLGLKDTGGNHSFVKKKITALGLSTSHWTGKAHMLGRKGKSFNKWKIEDILVENSLYKGKVKDVVLKEGLLKNECSICGKQPVWMDKPLVMILDHINGVHTDNRIENLRLVCPDCNSQLPTFAGRNVKREIRQRFCLQCGVKISRHSKSGKCVSCCRKG